MAERHGDFSHIVLRGRLGIPLTDGEQAAIRRLEQGDKLRTGPKDPATAAAESVVCWRWLVERSGWTPANAQSLLSKIMGTSAEAIRARITRSRGLARNFADLCFQVHVQRDVVPTLLRHRTPAGRHCVSCHKTRCKCSAAPRPAFAETPEAAQLAALLSFWRRPENPPETATSPPAGDDDPDGWKSWIRGGEGPAL